MAGGGGGKVLVCVQIDVSTPLNPVALYRVCSHSLGPTGH